MNIATESADSLRQQIAVTEKQLNKLKEQLANVEAQLDVRNIQQEETASPVTPAKWPLSSEEYKRYGRQMIVPNIGIKGWSYRMLFRMFLY